MHRKLPRHLFLASGLAGFGLLFAGCSSTQTPLPAESEPVQIEQPQAKTHALDRDQSIRSAENPISNEIQDPWQLVDMSAGKLPAESNALILKASELFLDQQHYSTAYTMLEEVDSSWLDENEKQYFALIHARYALLTGNTSRARTLLAQFPRNNPVSRENRIRLLQLDIAIAAQQLDFKRVVLSRIELDSLLFDRAQLVNQQRILNTLTRESELFSGSQTAAQNAILQGWLALASLNRLNRLSTEEIALWQQQYLQHPAQVAALAAAQLNTGISSRNIALLLPTTSKLGRAAEAFKAGFDAAASNNGHPRQSRVYDIGSETDLIGLYYQSAINDGADFIVGPLGRTGAQAMLAHLDNTSNPGVSTLLLGELPAEYDHLPNIWGLALSPEQDAAAIAERAISQGMRSALVLQKNNDWGTRLGEAFTQSFEAKGGTVVANQRYQPDNADHSYEVKKILDISRSEVRHKQLQNLLGTKLEFSVRRRNDIDFIFLAGNTRDARRVIPLAKFYRAHDLPIYATSAAFNGKFNRLTDEDLKDLNFADLPWLLNKQIEARLREKARIKAEKEAAEAQALALLQARTADSNMSLEEETTKPKNVSESSAPAVEESDTQNKEAPLEEPQFEDLPYSSATLNRLYALGYAAFEAIPRLSYLQSDEWYQFATRTMALNMDEHRNLRHRVAWGKYITDGIRISP
jgi:outer membrane PBP1 activator LpoA protein